MSTDSELKAAAERLRSIVPDERMWDEPAAQWSDTDKDLWVCAFAYVRHILAQRADDGELDSPVTEEWAGTFSTPKRTVTESDFETYWVIGTSNTGWAINLLHLYGFSSPRWSIFMGGTEVTEVKTRRDIINLLSALNVSTGGGAG